jgi:hypothetical protein
MTTAALRLAMLACMAALVAAPLSAHSARARLGNTSVARHVQPDSILRQIDLGEHGIIALGDTVPGRDLLLPPTLASLYPLRPGTFDGAEAIAVDLGPDRRVRAIHFLYEKDTRFDTFARNATLIFGQPVRSEGTTDAEAQLLVWQDSLSIAELERATVDGVARIRLRLIDRQLTGR